MMWFYIYPESQLKVISFGDGGAKYIILDLIKEDTNESLEFEDSQSSSDSDENEGNEMFKSQDSFYRKTDWSFDLR
jgi:hypothetical protein